MPYEEEDYSGDMLGGLAEEEVEKPDLSKDVPKENPDEEPVDHPAEQESEEPTPKPADDAERLRAEIERYKSELEVSHKRISDKDSYIDQLKRSVNQQPPKQEEKLPDLDENFFDRPQEYLDKRYVPVTEHQRLQQQIQYLGQQLAMNNVRTEVSSFFAETPDAQKIKEDIFSEINDNPFVRDQMPLSRDSLSLLFRLKMAERRVKELESTKTQTASVDQDKKARAKTTSSNASRTGQPGMRSNLDDLPLEELERMKDEMLARLDE